MTKRRGSGRKRGTKEQEVPKASHLETAKEVEGWRRQGEVYWKLVSRLGFFPPENGQISQEPSKEFSFSLPGASKVAPAVLISALLLSCARPPEVSSISTPAGSQDPTPLPPGSLDPKVKISTPEPDLWSEMSRKIVEADRSLKSVRIQYKDNSLNMEQSFNGEYVAPDKHHFDLALKVQDKGKVTEVKGEIIRIDNSNDSGYTIWEKAEGKDWERSKGQGDQFYDVNYLMRVYAQMIPPGFVARDMKSGELRYLGQTSDKGKKLDVFNVSYAASASPVKRFNLVVPKDAVTEQFTMWFDTTSSLPVRLSLEDIAADGKVVRSVEAAYSDHNKPITISPPVGK